MSLTINIPEWIGLCILFMMVVCVSVNIWHGFVVRRHNKLLEERRPR